MVVGDAGGSAKATWWVEEALDNARTWFPEMSESELRGPLEQAFELAGKVGRGEREFHEVFEAELRRAVEERDVVGSGDSVLPAQSAEAPKAFQAVAAIGPEATETSVETDAAREEHSREDDDSPAADERLREDDRAKGADAPREEPARDDDHARAFVVTVGALRFHDGLSSAEIQEELGIDAGYYSEATRWLLHQVDGTLEGDYPAHLDRRRMAHFAAGLETNEDTFAVERHVRQCPGCATYLADLLEASLSAVERGVPGAGGDGRPEASARTRESAPPVVTYTRENAWMRRREPGRRRRRSTPAISLKAAELRRYSRSPEVPSPGPLTEPVAEPEEPAPAATTHRPGGGRNVRRRNRRVRALVPVAMAAGAAAVAALIFAALPGGEDKQAPRDARADEKARATSAAAEREAAAQKAARARAVKAARERAERREQRVRAARRAARRRLAARRVRRRQSQRRAAAADAASAPSVAAPTPPPAAPAPEQAPAPAPPPAPATSAPPSGPSGEFGLEP